MQAPGTIFGHPHCLLPSSSPFPPSFLSPSNLTIPAPFISFLFPRRRIRWPCARGGGHSAWRSKAESGLPGNFRFRGTGGSGGAGGGAGAREEAEEGEGWGQWTRGKRRWWSDEDPYDDEDDNDDLLDDEMGQPWEKIWIFKVFKSYGYLLPAIIASMLLASGPKAFLMALALPLGQSALSLAIDKLWGNASKGSTPRYKTKKKPSSRSASDFIREEEEEIGRGYRGKEAYQSWVASEEVANDREGKSRAFGGWDELDRRREFSEGPARQQQSKTTATNSSRAQPLKKAKLSRRERNKEIPLFLRLLVAVFPFLGSWTRIL